MTSTNKHYAFLILQEVFRYLLHRKSTAPNLQALRLIVEAQGRVFAS